MLNKQPINLNFGQGLDQKSDPWQVPVGKFLNLQNSIFTKAGLLQKRNGFAALSTLATTANYLTTFKGNLTALDNSVNAYNESSNTWISKGNITPVAMNTLPLIRNSVNQTQCDAVVSPNGLVCTVYTEVAAAGTVYKYAIADVSTGQNIIAPVLLPNGSGTITGSPRVFIAGSYFVIVFTNLISTVYHLQYISVSSIHPTTVTTPQDIASSYIPTSQLSWDGAVGGTSLYLAYATTVGGTSVKVTYLNATAIALGGAPVVPYTVSGTSVAIINMCADNTSIDPIVYVNIYFNTNIVETLVFDNSLNILSSEVVSTTANIVNITSAAADQQQTMFYEIANNYSYDSGIASNYIESVIVDQFGDFGSPATIIRSVGLASRAFVIGATTYVLTAYNSPYQPSYFLIDGTDSTMTAPVIVAKLAYSNGGGYLTAGLPNVSFLNGFAYIPYLSKDLISAVNKNTNVPTGSQVAGIYSQTGINLVGFELNTSVIDTAEIGNNLNITGGFLWMYDGYLPVEHNFFLWPDSIEVAGSGTSGSMAAQAYFYQVTYEWSDNQGNLFRSAPSIPVSVTLTSDTSVTINVPTLRLTYKTANPVKICIYRWSATQQNYYQVTSIASPLLNTLSSDSVSFTDTSSDATILGNALIYTTGGVVEDVNAPTSHLMTLFDTRLWLVDDEDTNLLWYSKQVIENTPVEMSDLFTIYVAPTTGTTGSTGPITALSTMDDKLIIFKKDAIYYINGSGPDNTGLNSSYSQPIYVTSTVGCANQNSIVLTPNGLIFQSDKGLWLLNRGLDTQYIGAPVENYNTATVESALEIPGTNQVRFTLDSGVTLMYDYYFNQWGTFVGIPGISACIYNGLHTFINSYGAVYQETPNKYLDGSNPVALSFTTSWINLAGIQGYERAYDFYLLGQFLSPHNLIVQVAYEYAPYPSQQFIIQPNNFTGNYGSDVLYGQTPQYGGPMSLEQWKIHLQRQTCQSFQITVTEQFNPFFNTIPGAGLTLSGLTLRVGIKKGTRPIRAANSI